MSLCRGLSAPQKDSAEVEVVIITTVEINESQLLRDYKVLRKRRGKKGKTPMCLNLGFSSPL
jgi:hypothetical protein